MGREKPQRLRRRPTHLRVLSLLFAGALLASCGGEGEESTDQTGEGGERTPVVRFAYTPDAVIQYLIDEGILSEMEDEFDVRLVMTSTYDEFTFFAGGHGDVVSMGSFEIPNLETETGIKTTTFGQFTNNQNVIYVRGDDPAETLEDLVGRKIGIRGGGSGLLTASLIAAMAHDLDLREGGGDFEVVLTDDHLVNIDLLLRGEVDAVVGSYAFSAPYLQTGEMKLLYDGRLAHQVATDESGRQLNWGNNNFIARADWYADHPQEAEFVLAVAERGLQEWRANMEEIVRRYGFEFNADSEEDYEFILGVLEENDWFAPTSYIDQEFVDGELFIVDELKRLGLVDPDAEPPTFDIIEP